MGKHMVGHELTDEVVQITNKRAGISLGYTEWQEDWKTHVFVSEDGMEFSADCLEEIVKLLKRLDARRVAP
jgi:hypothetical protein